MLYQSNWQKILQYKLKRFFSDNMVRDDERWEVFDSEGKRVAYIAAATEEDMVKLMEEYYDETYIFKRKIIKK
ncbi:hypothetical protein [uncultured Methanobrevibacter sp.]|uniref:hypothetical protein n=1 Tax=uncultured Methanobrevibacter sp. TaxID=253161 RepID=UPI0025D25C51|nr:hypothetical protein [uncultured Methanobrevibacter sp.]